MNSENDLRDLLRTRAAQARPASAVHAGIRRGLVRRQRRQRAVSVTAAVLTVATLGLGVQALSDGALRGRDEQLPVSAAPFAAAGGYVQTENSHLAFVRRVYAQTGYTAADTAQLARVWSLQDHDLVRALAGQRLVDRGALPFLPGQGAGVPPEGEARDVAALRAFRSAGHDDADAAALARNAWRDADVAAVRVVAGQQIMDGLELPLHR